MAGVDSVLGTVTVINSYVRGKSNRVTRTGSATGFFYEQEGSRFLVTCKHVFVNNTFHEYPDFIEVKIHSNLQNFEESRSLEIELYDGQGRKAWIEHPRSNKLDIDLAAIDIGPHLRVTDSVGFWNKDQHMHPETTLGVGAQLVVLGCPEGLYDAKYNLPLVRAATLASGYGLHFDSEPNFLIDANLHPGTSGAPVITNSSTSIIHLASNKVLRNEASYHLVGVNCQPVQVHGTFLGLHKVIYSSLIQEMLQLND